MERTLNNKAIDCPLMRNADTFGYNARSEVVFSRRGEENAEYAYSYDNIGNLMLSAFNSETNTYTVNNLNQYTSIFCGVVSLREPTYDLDGNIVLYVSESGAIVTQYTYDPYGNMIDTYIRRACYFFAATGFGFGGAGSDWLGMNSIKGPGILRGEVYPTDDQGLDDTETLETTPY